MPDGARGVLLPELRSITDLAVANEDLETLVAAVTAAGLAGDAAW